MILTDDLY